MSKSQRSFHVTKADAEAILESRRDEIAAFTPVPVDPAALERPYLLRSAFFHKQECIARNRHPNYRMWRNIQQRAKLAKIPFSILPSDIVIPTHCPVLGIELDTRRVKLHDAYPTVDRIIPALGYTVENIQVMSWRANRIKRDGSAEEHERIAAWIRANHSPFLLD